MKREIYVNERLSVVLYRPLLYKEYPVKDFYGDRKGRLVKLSKKASHVKIEELKTDFAVIKNFELSIGRIFEETWVEPLGPTPFPSITGLREWDLKLLQRYKPFYLPFCDVCCLCTFGKCDLTGDKRGACGLKMEAQQSRIVLLAS